MSPPPVLSKAERIAAGKARRATCSREALAEAGTFDRDPVALIEQSSEGRIRRLVPLRYGRMLANPFAFFRGTALIQAVDLASTASSGLLVQACGDGHLMNFGGFATPERQLLFDINDFDETFPAPFEWDLKRLAASFVVAARHFQFGDEVGRAAAMRANRSYQEHIAEYAEMSELAVWYDHLTVPRLREAASKDLRHRLDKAAGRAAGRTHEGLLPKMGAKVEGRWVLNDTLPTVFHQGTGNSLIDDDETHQTNDVLADSNKVLAQYAGVLSDDRRVLFERHRLQDVAYKVVGVGSVGTRCLVMLLTDTEDNPLFLQFKEAGASVFDGRVPGQTSPEHNGRRIVLGQRLTQASSDPFLGWVTGPQGRHLYLRQLRDMKVSAALETFDPETLDEYASMCGWALARAHAKGGGISPEIRGYLGRNDGMVEAIGTYAVTYADQVQRDFDRFAKACRKGRLTVTTEEAFQADLVA